MDIRYHNRKGTAVIPHRKEWLEHYAQKTGVPVEKIEEAFKEELKKDQQQDEPLEIPDRIEMLYKYSYGGQSRFFRELRDNARLLGSKCKSCKTVYLPPRISCGECYADTDWVPLGDTGTVLTFTTVYFATSEFFDKTPFICAYIKVDGADTMIMQNVFMKDIKAARTGMRVKAVFKEKRFGNMGDFWFEPAD